MYLSTQLNPLTFAFLTNIFSNLKKFTLISHFENTLSIPGLGLWGVWGEIRVPMGGYGGSVEVLEGNIGGSEGKYEDIWGFVGVYLGPRGFYGVLRGGLWGVIGVCEEVWEGDMGSVGVF